MCGQWSNDTIRWVVLGWEHRSHARGWEVVIVLVVFISLHVDMLRWESHGGSIRIILFRQHCFVVMKSGWWGRVVTVCDSYVVLERHAYAYALLYVGAIHPVISLPLMQFVVLTWTSFPQAAFIVLQGKLGWQKSSWPTYTIPVFLSHYRHISTSIKITTWVWRTRMIPSQINRQIERRRSSATLVAGCWDKRMWSRLENLLPLLLPRPIQETCMASQLSI